MIMRTSRWIVFICFVISCAQASQSQEGESQQPSEVDLLKELIVKPNVKTLRQLLAMTGFEAAAPLSLVPQGNRLSLEDNRPVVCLSTEIGERVVVFATVRPKTTIGAEGPFSRRSPQAAFIFDNDGGLIRMLGGGNSALGAPEGVMLTNLGGTGDYFLRVSAFESHPPYGYCSRWYRIGANSKPSLTVHHHANSTSWSGGSGRSNPIAEYGFMQFDLSGQEIDNRVPGAAANGARVPRQILWDGLRNKFIAESTQHFAAKSLYQVIAEASVDFIPIQANRQTLVVAGGRRGFENWHKWMVAVQDGHRVVARLALRDAGGRTSRLIHEARLSPGQHKLQLHFADHDDAAKTRIQVMLNAKDTKDNRKYTIPRMGEDARPSVAGQCVYVAAKPPVRLFDKQLNKNDESLVWVIEDRITP